MTAKATPTVPRSPSSRPSSRRPAAPGSTDRAHGNRDDVSRRRRRLVLWSGAIAVGLVVAGVGWALLHSSYAAIRTVNVTGNAWIARGQVIDVAAVPLGVPMIQFDPSAVAARVEQIPEVSRVEVLRSWPTTVEIVVVPRIAVAKPAKPAGPAGPAGPVGSAAVAWDVSGRAFTSPSTADLPAVQAGPVEPGSDASPAQRAVLQVIAGLPDQLRTSIALASAATPDSVQWTTTDGKTVVWGGAGQGEQKAAVLIALRAAAGKAQRFDVSAPDLPTTS